MTGRLARYVEPSLPEARVAAQWRAIAARLPRRRARRTVFFLGAGVTCAVAAAAALLLWTRRAPERPATVVGRGAVVESLGEPLAVSLEDGSHIELAKATRVVVVDRRAETVRVRLDRGLAVFEVPREPGRRFLVNTGDVEVEVVGTRFAVHREAARVQVSVERGTVDVRRSGEPGPGRRLAAGESWSVSEVVAAEEPVAPPPAAGPARAPRPPRRPAPAPDEPVEPAPPGPEELFEEASAARRAGRTADAAAVYAELLERYPRDARAPLAAFDLGRLRMDSLGDLAGAVRALELALRLAPDGAFHEDAMARLVLAHDRLGAFAPCRRAQSAYLSRYPSGVHAKVVRDRCGGR